MTDTMSYSYTRPPVGENNVSSSDEDYDPNDILAQGRGPQAHDGEERENGEDLDAQLIVLTNGSPPLTTVEVTQIALLPEYPRTYVNGYTFCVHIDPKRLAFALVLEDAFQFQYCRKKKGPAKPTGCTFLSVPAVRYRLQCTGVKCCEYLDNSLKTASHSHVTPETWETLGNSRMNLIRTEHVQRKKNSTALYAATIGRFQSGIACPNQSPTCSPIYRQYRNQTVSGIRPWYIGCSNWSWQTRHTVRHFYKRLGDHHHSEHLKELFANGLPEEEEQRETCGVVFNTTTKHPNCDVDHPQGKGKLIQIPCDVIFSIIIPVDPSACPYYLFTSHGTHSHPPPPPVKTPEAVTQELVDLVRRANDPSLTVASFLRGNFLAQFCEKHRASSFTQVHQSLNNLDRIRQLIYREKLIMFPSGQDIAGVEFEKRIRHVVPEDAYIQDISTTPQGTAVLTVKKDQAIVFASIETFQVDLSFKRVGYRWHELIFAIFHEGHGKLFTLARVYVNDERTQLYQRCFEMVFAYVAKCTGKELKELKWRHLHQTGFIGITCDMDGKQMSGFGRFLSKSIDTYNRAWQWQLLHTVKFCKAHFLRSISTATGGAQVTDSSVHKRMADLLTCRSWDEYDTLCGLLMSNESQTVKNWAQHKRNIVIAAGLNRHITMMRQRDWDVLEETSNNVEQTAKKSYSYGVRLRLLPAIFQGLKLDTRDIDQYQSREQTGMRHSERPTALSARYSKSMARDKRKRTKEDEIHQGYESDVEPEDQIIFQASSSGHIRARGLSKRGRSAITRGRSSSRARSSSRPSNSSRVPTTPQEPFPMAFRTSSSSSREPSLQRHVLQQNLDFQSQQETLDLRQRKADIKKQELENLKLEIELEEKRRALKI